MVMRHRLTCALGNEIPGVPHISAPFQCIDVQAEGSPVLAQAPKATTLTTGSIGAQVQQKNSRMHQSQAGFQAVTTTTPSSYYNSTQQNMYQSDPQPMQPNTQPINTNAPQMQPNVHPTSHATGLHTQRGRL